jgi:hypothetical protein
LIPRDLPRITVGKTDGVQNVRRNVKKCQAWTHSRKALSGYVYILNNIIKLFGRWFISILLFELNENAGNLLNREVVNIVYV